MPKGLQGFQKGNSLGSQAKNNVLASRMRIEFINGARKWWNKLMQAQFRDSIDNYKARQYVIDQVIGRPKESLEIEGGPMINIDKAIILNLERAYGGKFIGNGKVDTAV